MERELLTALVTWKDKAVHLPLLLRGARQVGKTFLVRDFAKRYFEHYVEVNFEEQPQYAVFERTSCSFRYPHFCATIGQGWLSSVYSVLFDQRVT